jgi:branched-chain amino acid transport system substrate-binding protein
VIRVGAALSLSGGFAAQGEQARRGLALWAADANAAGGIEVRDRGGRWPVELFVRDDQSRSGPAAAGAERLIVDDAVDLLVGPYSSVLTLAVAPVAERHRKVLWNHGGSSDAVASRGFRFAVNLASPASQYLAEVLRMARALDPSATRVALLHGARGTFPQAAVAGAEAYARQYGLRVVVKAAYPPAGPDFADLVARVAARQPEVVLGVGRTEADLEVARELSAQRVRVRVAGLVAAPLWSFGRTLGDAAEGLVGPSQWEPGAGVQPDVGPAGPEFVARYRDQFREEPDYPAAQAYAAGLVAQFCVNAAGTLRDEPLRDAAARLAFTTFYGGFALDAATGEQVGHRLVLTQWQDGAKPVVWPAALAEAPPRIPMRP